MGYQEFKEDVRQRAYDAGRIMRWAGSRTDQLIIMNWHPGTDLTDHRTTTSFSGFLYRFIRPIREGKTTADDFEAHSRAKGYHLEPHIRDLQAAGIFD